MIKRLTICLMIGLWTIATYGQETFRGNASYYADRFHGRKMSNGQRYHRDSMTCAHLKLPFGTMLKVRNPKNGKEVIVEVTDRGPYSKKFVIDVSWAAAKELDILRAGYSMMEITKLPPEGIPYRKREEDIVLPPFTDFDEPPAYFFENNDTLSDSISTEPASQPNADKPQTTDKAGSEH